MQVKSYLSMIGFFTLLIGSGVILSLTATNPTQLGPYGVTVWFVGLLAAMAGAATLSLFILKTVLRVHDTNQKRLQASWRQGILISLALTVMLALASLRQLAIRDVVIIAIMIVLVEFYFRTRA